MRPASRPRSPASALAVLVAASLGGCGPQLLYEARGELALDPVLLRLVRVTDAGLSPAGAPGDDGPVLRVKAGGGGLIVLNDTRDRVVSVVLPDHACTGLRCSYTRGFEAAGGATFTTTPLVPGASASLCVHDAGRFALEVHGASLDAAAVLRGTIEATP